ncbi:MAG TPA: AsmA family protein [Gammaproteobacteria bacterium]|nr:AsmA family protein [Gammaproteobacteria bacterium]
MRRTLKLIGIIAGAVLVLLVVTLVAVGMLFDPNDYKDQIVAAAERATGRKLTLDGDLDLAVFPSIRIAVGSASISNAPGFGDAPMAKIGGAELKVALLPLLGRRIEVSEARLHGLELNLARDARGRNNWQDLGGASAAQAPAPTPADNGSGAAQGLDLGVGAIQISDARVTWNDAATRSRWELTNFGLEANGFGPGKKFPLKMRFGLAGADVKVAVDASTQATLALADNAYKLEQLAVKIDGSGAAWPGGSGTARLAVDSLAADLGKESLALDGLTLDFLGITMAGSLAGQKLMSDLSLTGAVDIREFNPRDVLGVFKVDLETADSAVLRRASAKANLLYTSSQLGLRDMQLKLDDSTLTGRVGLEGEKLAYSLSVDDINVDRYLPPSEDSSAPAGEGSLDEVDLPLDALRKLQAAGDLKFGKAKFSGLTLTNASFGLAAANGKLRLTPKASLYGGTWNGQIDLDVQANAAKATIAQQLEHVDLVPLGKDLLGSADVAGIGDVKLDLVASGSNVGEMRRGLDGNVSFSVTNGALEGIDLWYELRRARARLDNDPVPERGNDPRRTTFSSLAASGTIEDALLTNRDLTGVLDFMRITGTGSVNLLNDMLNFDLKAAMVDGPKLQSDPAMAKYAGDTLPLRVTGTIDAPSVLPDFSAIVKSRITKEADKKLDEEKQKASDRLQDRLRGLLNR